MKKPILHFVKAATFLLFLTAASSNAQGQYYFYNDSYYASPIVFEIGASGSVVNSLTDIGGKKGIGGKFLKDLNMGCLLYTSRCV